MPNSIEEEKLIALLVESYVKIKFSTLPLPAFETSVQAEGKGLATKLVKDEFDCNILFV
jgi:hypothetical protein